MNEHPFQVGGPLLAGMPVYVERQADEQAYFHLLRMDYLTLIETRQQGKTSLINNLIGRFQNQNYVFAYASIEILASRQIDEATWYTYLADGLLRQIKFIPASQRPPSPKNGAEWFNFLTELGELAAQAHKNLVIALDEIGGTPPDWATDFFAAIRSTFVYRQIQPTFQHLTFILAGAYNPRKLITNPNISPFNVAKQVHLEDFTVEQIKLLTAHLDASPEIQNLIAERIHYWTDGQPYLSHCLCQALVGQSLTADSVDMAAEELPRADNNHLPHVFAFSQSQKLVEYVKQIASGASVGFAPVQSSRQMQLALLGIIKADKQGVCKIRNRLYEQALAFLEDSAEEHSWPSIALRRNSLKKRMIKHMRRLQILKDIQAYHGINTDPKILMEIEDIEAEIEKLQTELAQL
ncbi:MAG: AAA-like domain-containing protein [Chloroflexi bacterium]|nr:AAA-like domain-containing protein [Chloroflexota bacterium]